MDDNDDKYRVVTLLTEEEKDALQTLAWRVADQWRAIFTIC